MHCAGFMYVNRIRSDTWTACVNVKSSALFNYLYVYARGSHIAWRHYWTAARVASHAVVFRGLVLPPPHKRLLTQAPHSFPIVWFPKHPSQSPSRHCLMISNQIAGYNGRFREFCTVSGTILRDAGVKLEDIYFFTSGMAGHGWNAKTNIECEYKRFLCDVLTALFAGRVKIFGKV